MLPCVILDQKIQYKWNKKATEYLNSVDDPIYMLIRAA